MPRDRNRGAGGKSGDDHTGGEEPDDGVSVSDGIPAARALRDDAGAEPDRNVAGAEKQEIRTDP